MDAANWLASIITGGAAGYLSSVHAAGPVARRQETTRRRMQAQQQLHDIVSAYLGRLSIGRPGQLGPNSIYADDYADLAGREQLALAVHEKFPHYGKRTIGARIRLARETGLIIAPVPQGGRPRRNPA